MKSLLTILVFSSLLLFSANIQAAKKDSSKTAQKENIAKFMATKLQQKILLSDGQVSQVETIITSYLALKVKTDKDTEKTLEKVEELLDKRQKAKYSIIKDDWWSYLAKHLNN
jgi:preprotein translocase subunit YajC